MKKRHNGEPLRRTTYSSGIEVVEAWDYYQTPEDFRLMGRAVAQAKRAIRQRDVGIGAVLVSASGKFWEAHSTELSEGDPYAHAEVNVTRLAKATVKTCYICCLKAAYM